jgi:ankyrin repeat protein
VNNLENDTILQIKELYTLDSHTLEATDECGQTALHHAAALGHYDIVKFIIGVTPVSLLNKKDNK